MKTLIHVTHEVVQKVGGIGAVLHGLFTSKAYNDAVERTVLVGPLFTTEGKAEDRLGRDGEVFYSSLDGRTDHPAGPQLREVQEQFNVDIVYGRRKFADRATGLSSSPEVLLIDVGRIDVNRLNAFKGRLWQHYQLDSSVYEKHWEYDLYVKLAEPAIAALHAIGACPGREPCVVLAHEFMGMPTALAAMIDPRGTFRSVFYAHEVATMRRIVEGHPGHDTMFYNVLSRAVPEGRYVEDVFGSQHDFFKHGLISAAKHCDNILAVGDYVIKELRFLGPDFEHVNADLAYNGIPAYELTAEQASQSKQKLQRYTEALLDYTPDYVFTHVTRMATSKGLWRDFRVLEQVERAFRRSGKTGVLFVLSSEVAAPRRPEEIRNLEQWWHWPVAHRERLPDLSPGEAVFYVGVQEFNARARNVKALLVNQFGWSHEACGTRMPADMEFTDIRRGSDVEFGQSIYEPFGIAQLEPLSFGGICVISNVCGCAGFVDDVTEGEAVPSVIVADYTELGREADSVEELLKIGKDERDEIEAAVARKVADQIVKRLPTTASGKAKMIRRGFDLAKHMSWEVVARDYFLPGIERALRKERVHQVA